MVDFFDHDDQESIEFAESILEAAARHHILIHLHGVWKPTGWQRTYPNLMNHEGALNLEYLKWSDRCTPEHNLMMAFTRLIAGPMDYHLGGFRAVPRAQFKPRNVAPNVLGTRVSHARHVRLLRQSRSDGGRLSDRLRRTARIRFPEAGPDLVGRDPGAGRPGRRTAGHRAAQGRDVVPGRNLGETAARTGPAALVPGRGALHRQDLERCFRCRDRPEPPRPPKL